MAPKDLKMSKQVTAGYSQHVILSVSHKLGSGEGEREIMS
jgi:hypothetical protein